ncbi:MAG: hypothetical protein IKU11_01935 [Clostridia bacterium]|nr:hypothetical protein [Clostridia bacterium]
MNYKRTKFACFYSYVATAAVFSLPPLLFVTFRETYGISYTLLGTLVLVNFFTQLGVDLIFTFFPKYFNIRATMCTMPLLSTAGFLIYALIPTFFPDIAYLGLLLGTITFSLAAGLGEVFLSPTIAALPSEHPDRDMSTLHSLYGYGVVMVVSVSTLFFWLFGRENWMYLTLFWALLPIVTSILFFTSPFPEMNLTHNATSAKSVKARNWGIALCFGCIFFGSAAENGMTNWISSFIESALHIPKAAGDLLGLALFAVLLAMVRTVYAKYGRNIYRILFLGMIAATACYLVAGLASNAIVAMIACVVTGISTSMLWPGTLIYMEEKIPNPGVVAYALMAAGGDTGASVAPQMMGAIVDAVSVSEWGTTLAATLSLSPEQVGMKTSMILSAVFPFIGIFLLLYMNKFFKKNKITED